MIYIALIFIGAAWAVIALKLMFSLLVSNKKVLWRYVIMQLNLGIASYFGIALILWALTKLILHGG